MVAIVTEAWVLAGCGTASKTAAQEAPVQQHPPAAAKAKKAASFRGISTIRCQDRREAIVISRRSGLASCVLAAVAAASFSPLAVDCTARAAILEEDDDVELLERVKEDRKKRLEKQGIISTSGTETGYLQDLIYKLSKVGQAIEKDDLPAAGSVLGPSSDAQWVQNVNVAFSKFSSSPEEKDMVDSFNSSLASLITSVAPSCPSVAVAWSRRSRPRKALSSPPRRASAVPDPAPISRAATRRPHRCRRRRHPRSHTSPAPPPPPPPPAPRRARAARFFHHQLPNRPATRSSDCGRIHRRPRPMPSDPSRASLVPATTSGPLEASGDLIHSPPHLSAPSFVVSSLIPIRSPDLIVPTAVAPALLPTLPLPSWSPSPTSVPYLEILTAHRFAPTGVKSEPVELFFSLIFISIFVLCRFLFLCSIHRWACIWCSYGSICRVMSPWLALVEAPS